MWTITIVLDPALPELAISVEAPDEATILWVKEELCRQDSVGASAPDSFKLCSLNALEHPLEDDLGISDALQILTIYSGGQGAIAEEFEGEAIRLVAHESISWEELQHELAEDDEIDDYGVFGVAETSRTQVRSTAFVDEGSATDSQQRAESEAKRRVAEETSRKRIANAGSLWYEVLGVSASAPASEVKKAFRQLALLHHPDKSLSNDESHTFKRILQAYEESWQVLHKGNGSEQSWRASWKASSNQRRPPAHAGYKAQQPPRAKKATTRAKEPHHEEPAEDPTNRVPSNLWRVRDNASKDELKEKTREWINAPDCDEKTAPINVCMVAPRDLVEWLRKGSCKILDTREEYPAESRLLHLGEVTQYASMAFSPDKLSALFLALKREGKQIVFLSDRGRRVGTCGLAASLIIDIFGFETSKVFCMEGGYREFCRYMEQHVDELFVGTWVYGKKPSKYSVSREGNGELRFVGPHSTHGTITGILQWRQAGWLQAELRSKEGIISGEIKLTLGFGGCLVSKFKGVTMKGWGVDIIASREERT